MIIIESITEFFQDFSRIFSVICDYGVRFFISGLLINQSDQCVNQFDRLKHRLQKRKYISIQAQNVVNEMF